MHLDKSDPENLLLADIPAPLAVMLIGVPDIGEAGVEGPAADRLFPEPSRQFDENLNEEWREYVVPGIKDLFASSREILRADLSSLSLQILEAADGAASTFFSVEFPRDHAMAWLNALNQARLVLAERINYTEKDSSRFDPHVPPTERGMAVYQIELFAIVQEWLLDALQ